MQRVGLGIAALIVVFLAVSQPSPVPADPPYQWSVTAGLPQQTEFEKIVATPAKEPEPTLADPPWQQSVYPVRVVVNGSTYSGSAVAVAPDKFHSAKHVWVGGTPEIEIDGQWVKARPIGVASKDLLVLVIDKPLAKPVAVRVPVYGEAVQVYGLRTKSRAKGWFFGNLNTEIGSGLVPLRTGETAVDNGDSGGGVFGEDGALLGTITGHATDSKLLTLFVPIVADAPKAAAPEVATPAKPKGRWVYQQFCERGRCGYRQVWIAE